MADTSEGRFDTLDDKELRDHVESGHVDPVAGQAELDRRAKEAAKAPGKHEAPENK